MVGETFGEDDAEFEEVAPEDDIPLDDDKA